MDEKVTFGEPDFRNLELVRHVVFRILKDGRAWAQVEQDPGFEEYVAFPEDRYRRRFHFLVQTEVLWELMFQGIISPGMDLTNPRHPFFHVTDYGREVLAADRFVPHDPAGYIREVRAAGQVCVSEVTLAYLKKPCGALRGVAM